VRILVLCTGNSARSQMAEGLLRHMCPAKTEIVSAGTAPTHLHPESVAALAELGIDISHHTSKHVDTVSSLPFDVLITVCDHAREVCPILPGVPRQLHWSLPDPAAVDEARRPGAFREVRELLRAHIERFVRES
jgi:arsenate reductase